MKFGGSPEIQDGGCKMATAWKSTTSLWMHYLSSKCQVSVLWSTGVGTEEEEKSGMHRNNECTLWDECPISLYYVAT